MNRFMKEIYISLIAMMFLLSSCASKLMIQSDPPQAEVFASSEGKTEKIKLGQTPVEITEAQINEQLKVSPENTEWIFLTIEKKNYEKRFIALPANRWGELSKNIRLQLKPMEDNETVVTKMLKYFFNAKKFAETKQYDQAHTEIDKVLVIDNKMTQALSMKAGIYFLQGNFEEAKVLYKKALEIDPGFSDAIQMLERIQNKAGSSQ
ncbi:MAG: tetratricopeptide repeat protein [Bdellovibrionaceae bacterium]|nr:tetratricopeptide repeat protein [Pseudobdellovibrionaceae bacterium]